LITLGQEGIGKLARKAQKNTIRVGDWKVSTALQQTRTAMNEENPGNKRIIQKPAATRQRQTNLLSKPKINDDVNYFFVCKSILFILYVFSL
jgi:hypothetical protein